MLDEINLHTILRLPTGIFYAHGVKANVLFFDLKKSSKKQIWIYDYRTNIHHTPKKNPLQFENLKHFVECYNSKKRKETWSSANPEGRWRRFEYKEILDSDKVSLDLFWLKDKNFIDLDNLPDADDLINDIIENIESALANFKAIRDTISE